MEGYFSDPLTGLFIDPYMKTLQMASTTHVRSSLMLKPPSSFHHRHLTDGGLALPNGAVSHGTFGELLSFSNSVPSSVKRKGRAVWGEYFKPLTEWHNC